MQSVQRYFLDAPQRLKFLLNQPPPVLHSFAAAVLSHKHSSEHRKAFCFAPHRLKLSVCRLPIGGSIGKVREHGGIDSINNGLGRTVDFRKKSDVNENTHRVLKDLMVAGVCDASRTAEYFSPLGGRSCWVKGWKPCHLAFGATSVSTGRSQASASKRATLRKLR